MGNVELTAEAMLRTFPEALRGDVRLWGLAVAAATEAAAMRADAQRLRLYAAIDLLPAELLDRLAAAFKLDWWSADYSESEKKELLKLHWLVHKKLGTKGAMLDALKAIYKEVEIEEWFAYDGLPYHYRMTLETGGRFTDADKLRMALDKQKYYRNVRSVLDGVFAKVNKDAMLFYGCALQIGERARLVVQ